MEPWMCPLLVVAAMAGAAAAGSLRYDQAQTGDTNIHLEVKNVEVLALLGDSSFEYEYDDGDMTERPPKPGANGTWASNDPVVESANSNVTDEEQPVLGSTTSATASSSATSGYDTTPTPPPPQPSSAPSGYDTTPTPPPPPASGATPTKRARRCGTGFHRDANGHCRRVRRPNLQMLMNLGRKPQTDTANPPTQ